LKYIPRIIKNVIGGADMKKILIVVIAAVLVIGMIGTGTVVLAKNDAGSNQTITAQDNLTKGQILRRLLLIQNEAKVDNLLAKAVSNGKINQDQSDKIKNFWVNNHARAAKFVKAVIAKRVLRVQNEANLKTFLDKQVASHRLTDTQETHIITFWEKNHQK
jgi:hypothetical protein